MDSTKDNYNKLHKSNIHLINVQESIEQAINDYLRDKGYNQHIKLLPIAEHLDYEGDFCFIANTIIPRDTLKKVETLATDISQIRSIEKVNIEVNKRGKQPIVYINITVAAELKREYFTKLIKKTCKHATSEEFGTLEDNKGKIAVVEHTSANPISPIHVGNLRNTIQGDTFARMLESTGYTVYRHYLINDGGLQIGFTAIGYKMLMDKGIRPAIKFDHWLGQVYAIMNLFYNSQKIKSKFSHLKLSNNISKISGSDVKSISEFIEKEIRTLDRSVEEIQHEIITITKKKEKAQKKRDLAQKKRNRTKLYEEKKDVEKYYRTDSDLAERFPKVYSLLYKAVGEVDLVQMTSDFLQRYETGDDKEIVKLFRQMVNWTLESFKWTLRRYKVHFDSFDFETDISWSNRADEFLIQLSKTEDCVIEGKAVRFRYSSHLMRAFMKDLGLSKRDLKIRGSVPDLQLSRSNGTSLYVMKDLAYSVLKFETRNADVVYNVVGEEQALAQFQLLPLLYKLGYQKYAKYLHHYGYEIVNLVGRTMSGRLARYVTADQFFDETFVRARMAKRASEKERGETPPQSDEEFKEEESILTAVTLATTRFPLIETSPSKRIQLDLDRELDMKRNSGPFILYAHARTMGILLKVSYEEKYADYSTLWDNPEVNSIIIHLQEFEDVLRRGVSEMDPSKLTDWIFKLAQYFMKFYEKNQIMREQNIATKHAKLSIVRAVKNALMKSMSILGIPVTERI